MQVSDFRYFGCDTSFYKNKNLNDKLHKFEHIYGSLSRILKNKAGTQTKLTFYKVMSTLALLTWFRDLHH